MHTHPLKRIRLKNAHNLRDLGGFIGKDHRFISWGKLFRSDSLSHLEANEWNVLVQMGIRTVIDLRSQAELESQPSTPPGEISLIHAPLLAEQMDMKALSEAALEAFTQSMEEGYGKMVTDHPELLVRALRALIDGLQRGSVLFHCSAGKDRTGILAAVLLKLLGAAEEDIIADYEVSYTYNRKGINHFAKKMPQFDRIAPLLRSDAVNMDKLLRDFERLDLPEFLLMNGVTAEELERLDAALLN